MAFPLAAHSTPAAKRSTEKLEEGHEDVPAGDLDSLVFVDDTSEYDWADGVDAFLTQLKSELLAIDVVPERPKVGRLGKKQRQLPGDKEPAEYEEDEDDGGDNKDEDDDNEDANGNEDEETDKHKKNKKNKQRNRNYDEDLDDHLDYEYKNDDERRDEYRRRKQQMNDEDLDDEYRNDYDDDDDDYMDYDNNPKWNRNNHRFDPDFDSDYSGPMDDSHQKKTKGDGAESLVQIGFWNVPKSSE